MTQRMNELHPNQGGVIQSVSGSHGFRRRLMAMGVTPGASVIVRRFAPLGDPIEIRVRDCSLSIRKQDAAGILVELAGEGCPL